MKSFLGNFYRHLAIFFWSHWGSSKNLVLVHVPQQLNGGVKVNVVPDISRDERVEQVLKTTRKQLKTVGGSPGVVVMGGDSCSKCRGFKSWHCKYKNKRKKAEDGPFKTTRKQLKTVSWWRKKTGCHLKSIFWCHVVPAKNFFIPPNIYVFLYVRPWGTFSCWCCDIGTLLDCTIGRQLRHELHNK